MTAVGPPAPAQDDGDLAALAKGGRTNFIGFLLRLAARLPFLFIAGRLYGAAALGRFASALVVVELVALLCSMGEKRGLAQRLSESDDDPAGLVFDAILLATGFSVLAALFFWFLPEPLFPSGRYTQFDRLIVLAIPAYALTEIVLAAQAYRYDIATTVRARAVVEPWTISIMAGVLFFIPAVSDSGLSLAYLISIYTGLLTGLWSFLRSYGPPRGWRPHPVLLWRQTTRALPLATADAIEWGTRRVDIFILGFFAAPSAVGIYYIAQQVASLPQKLKTSFEPILGPVITKNLKTKNYAAIAKQVCQVGFWIIAAQAGIALALGVPGEAVMGLVGPIFVGGTGALAFLLAAEVVAATAVVSEAVLIYVARIRNLWISIGTIAVQAALTVVLIMLAERLGYGEPYKAAAAAVALMIALGLASLVKALLLSRLLGEPINNFRIALVWAAAPAVVVGFLATKLPEWIELVVGIPAILFVYGWVIWHKGFGPEDRVLFRRNIAGGETPAPSPIFAPAPWSLRKASLSRPAMPMHTVTSLAAGAVLVAGIAYAAASQSGPALAERLSDDAERAIARLEGSGITPRFSTRFGMPTRHPVLLGGTELDQDSRTRIARAVAAISGVGGVSWAQPPIQSASEEQEFTPLHCQDDVEGLLRTRSIRFQEGSSALLPASDLLLDEVADALRPCLGSIIAIIGHTDQSGTEVGNLELSLERAVAVRDALIARGIPRDGLRARGLGSQKPVEGLAPTDPANRRIEFSVIATEPLRPTPIDTPGPR